MRKIQTLARDAAFDKDPWLKAFGLHVDMRMVNFDGRVLAPPRIQYGGNRPGGVSLLFLFFFLLKHFSFQSAVMPRDGVWRFEQERFYVPAGASAYAVLVVGRRKDDPAVV